MARIVVVDDAEVMRAILKQILIDEGHQVVGEAATGAQAVELYRRERPDLVTMDITMPDMDGVSALKEIRKLDDTAKVIMCSAIGQQRLILSAIEAGAKDFIVKPFTKATVLEAVGKIFPKR